MDVGKTMRLTTKSRYGTRLILDIAVYGKEKPVPLSDIARRQNMSLKYLEHLTRKLKKAGLIKTQRGPFHEYDGLVVSVMVFDRMEDR